MARWSIWTRLLAALLAGVLATVLVSAGMTYVVSPRATLAFAASKVYFPDEFSRDGALLRGRIVRGSDKTDPIAVWEVATGKQIAQFADLPRWTTFSPDGQLAFVDGDGRFALRNPVTLTEQVTAVTGLPPDTQAAFSADGIRLATLEWKPDAKSRQVRLWDRTSGKGRVLFADSHGEYKVGAIQFSPDGRKLGVLLPSGVVRFWDTNTGAERGQYHLKTDTVALRCWVSPSLDKVVLTGWWSRLSSSWDDDVTGDDAEETTLWALPPTAQQPLREGQGAELLQRVGYTRYGSEIRLIEPSVRVGLISSVTFTDQGRVFGTRFASEGGLLGNSEVLAVWAIDDKWKRVGTIPGCADGLVSPDGKSVAVATHNFGGIELWPLPSTAPPTQYLAGLAAVVGLLTAGLLWRFSGRGSGSQNNRAIGSP
jgi:WD40 repeat protein